MTVLVPTTLMSSFRNELPQALHNFTASTGNAFKMLLIKSSPAGTYSAAITNAGTPGSGTPSTSNVGTDEVTGTGYTSGGFPLTNVTPVLNGGASCIVWSTNPNWTSATITTIGALAYNTTNSNRAVAEWDLTGGSGTPQSVTGGTLTLVQGTQTAGSAPIQI